MNKLAILCVVALIVMLPLVSLIGCQSTPESKTYTNSQYGFSVEYPKDWDMQEGVSGAIVAFTPPTTQGAPAVIINIMSENLPETPKVTLKDYSDAIEQSLKDINDYQKLDEYDTTIGGEPAMVLTYTANYEGTTPLQISYGFFLKEDTAYIITYGATPESYDGYVDCFKLVMSNFRFE